MGDRLRIGAGVAALLLLASCGEESAPTVIAAEAPSSDASAIENPQYTMPPEAPRGLEVLRRWLPYGAEPGFRYMPIAIQSSNGSFYLNPEVINYDDPRIRHLGGRHSQPSTWPRYLMWWPQAVSKVVDPTYEPNGFSYDRTSVFDGFQFVLPAGQREFELFSLDDGFIGGVYIEIDGVRASKAPVSLGHGNQGARRWSHITVPASDRDRDIRIVTTRASIGELRLPVGDTLGARKSEWDERPRVVIVGDSISEGQGAGHAADSWAIELAYRLGINDPVNVSLGGTGYLRRAGARPNFREHIADVAEAFGEDEPDAVFVAGGINDCAVYSPSEIETEAGLYFNALRAISPDIAIIVFGPFAGPSGYDAGLQACADAIFAAANNVEDVRTIDVSDWVTPENTGYIFSGVPGDPHPVLQGHRTYAKKAEMAVRQLLDGLVPDDRR